MSELVQKILHPTEAPIRRDELPIARAVEPKRKLIGLALRAAITHMIESGDNFVDAGAKEGLSARAMRKAFGRGHVLAYVRQRRQEFRASLCAANEHRLAALRDQDENRAAAVQAVRVLERISETDDVRPVTPSAPGLVIVIQASDQRDHVVGPGIIEGEILTRGD